MPVSEMARSLRCGKAPHKQPEGDARLLWQPWRFEQREMSPHMSLPRMSGSALHFESWVAPN